MQMSQHSDFKSISSIMDEDTEPFHDEYKPTNVLKQLLNSSQLYRVYKQLQRFANIYYSMMVLSLVIILSIMSNTLFSLGYIIVLSIMMFKNRLFLNVHDARNTLAPILKKYVLPYMIFEMLCSVAYNIPFDLFNPELPHSKIVQHLPSILGLVKYYKVDATSTDIPFISRNESHIFSLWCKALVYFFISIQIQIIGSTSFERLEDYLSLGKLKGEAVTYLFSNLKIHQYFKYQNINLKKEQMMIKVKEKCDKWKEIFEAQAKKDETKLGIVHEPEVKATAQISPDQIVERDSEHSRDSDVKIEKLDESEFAPVKMIRDSHVLQSVNSDYLALRKMSLR